MLFNRHNKMRKIKNRVISSYEDLVCELEEVENQMAHMQRERDMRVNQIDNYYKAKIALLIRTSNLIKDEMQRTKKYIGQDNEKIKREVEIKMSTEPLAIEDIIPTPANIKKYDKKSDK